jgi:2-phosphoglycerate kinase
MIYLIGGSPRSGKSILAKRLAKKLDIAYLSTDNIRPIAMPYFSKKEQSTRFPFESMLVKNDFEKFFKKYSGREIIAADIKEAGTIWPGVKSLIEYLLKCEMNYVIEGVHLLPSLVRKFRDNKKIKIVFLTKKDEKKIYDGFIKNRSNNDWVADNIKDEAVLRKTAKAMADCHPYFVKEAKKSRLKLINTDTNFDARLNEAERYLVK